MRTDAPGESALLMLDVVAALANSGIDYAIVGAMAAAVHGVVRASLDADAVVSLQVREAVALKHTFDAAGLATDLRIGDPDDPIPALLAITDSYGNRVDLLIGLRGLEPCAFVNPWTLTCCDGSQSALEETRRRPWTNCSTAGTEALGLAWQSGGSPTPKSGDAARSACAPGPP